LSIPYIQGAARIPPEFNRVATIEAVDGGEAIVLRSDTGRQIRVGCRIDFLSTGKLPGIRFAP
jgi:hypothetical protein